MAQRTRRGGSNNGLDAWPGYVDALSTLLMVVMFVLLVFVLAQAFQSVVLAKRNEDLSASNRDLTVERERTLSLSGSVARMNQDLTAGEQARATLEGRVRDLNAQTARTMAEKDKLSALLREVELAAAASAILNQTLTARVEATDRDRAGLTTQLVEQTRRADTATRTGEQLSASLAARTAEIEQMRREAAAAEARLKTMREQLAALDRTVTADRATIEAKLSDLARLTEQIAALTALRDSLQQQARAVESRLGDEKKRGDSAEARLASLTGQVARLRADLDTSEHARTSEQSRAAGLTEQLNLALAAQVEELRKYRSDFFGKLRSVLAERPGVTIVGDRFVFQSEVLFGVSSAELTQAGMAQMADLAVSFRKITDQIPPDVNWVLRVDGHTDSVPVSNARFRSNWELSAARAITVVKFLITQGISARHLAATGFGENQPVDPEDTPEAYAKNRRIEIRLTDR